MATWSRPQRGRHIPPGLHSSSRCWGRRFRVDSLSVEHASSCGDDINVSSPFFLHDLTRLHLNIYWTRGKIYMANLDFDFNLPFNQWLKLTFDHPASEDKKDSWYWEDAWDDFWDEWEEKANLEVHLKNAT